MEITLKLVAFYSFLFSQARVRFFKLSAAGCFERANLSISGKLGNFD